MKSSSTTISIEMERTLQEYCLFLSRYIQPDNAKTFAVMADWRRLNKSMSKPLLSSEKVILRPFELRGERTTRTVSLRCLALLRIKCNVQSGNGAHTFTLAAAAADYAVSLGVCRH